MTLRIYKKQVILQKAMRDLAREENEEEEKAGSLTASQEEFSKQRLVYVAGYLWHKLAHKYQWMEMDKNN